MKEFIERLQKYELLTVKEISIICDMVSEIMICEPNIQRTTSNCYIVGDIHGQFSDLLNIFNTFGTPETSSYVFLGDYVDRGENSLECILLLLVYKILYPKNIFLLRGNHEQKCINKTYGFYQEVEEKYKDNTVWILINNVFSYFQLCCIVDNKYLCVHGGISSRISINKLERIDRLDSIHEDSLINDILWSDPYYKPGCLPNPRGSGFLFSIEILKQFLMFNNLDILIRSHQLAIEGYKFDFENLCLTVWSAPNYMGKCINPGSVLHIEKNVPITPRSLKLFNKTKKINKI